MSTNRSNSGRRPKAKSSRVKPTRNVSPHLSGLLPQLRSYVWKYEPKWNEEKQEWVWHKPARSPKPGKHRKIRWSEENFEQDKHLWGTFQEAYRAYANNPYDLQGVGFLVEPDHRFQLGGEHVYIVWIDLDGYRNTETGEIERWAIEILQAIDTYAEVSPSGEGIRIIGCITEPKEDMGCLLYTLDGLEFSYSRHIPESSRYKYHRVEVYGANFSLSVPAMLAFCSASPPDNVLILVAYISYRQGAGSTLIPPTR